MKEEEVGITLFRYKLQKGAFTDYIVTSSNEGLFEVRGADGKKIFVCKFYAESDEKARLWINL